MCSEAKEEAGTLTPKTWSLNVNLCELKTLSGFARKGKEMKQQALCCFIRAQRNFSLIIGLVYMKHNFTGKKLLSVYFLQQSTFRNAVGFGAFTWCLTPTFPYSQVMFTACELGVFDLLLKSGEPLSSDAIAARLGTSAMGMERLLDACVGLKLLAVELTQGGGNKGRRRGRN